MNCEPAAEPFSCKAVLMAAQLDGVLFDLDGVVTDTAGVHAAAWTKTFDSFLKQSSQKHNTPFEPFTRQDYLSYVDSRPRMDAIRTFTARRGLVLPEGKASDGPDRDTVHGLSARKNLAFLAQVRCDGVDIYPSTVALIHQLRAAGIKVALVTASRNCGEILRIAGLDSLFDTTVDGNDRAALNLRGKPAPDTFVEAAQRLGVTPARSVVVEDAMAGVAAARGGGFGLVIGVDRAGQAEALCWHGADLVVSDLDEIDVHAADVILTEATRNTSHPDVRRLDPFGQQQRQRRHFDAAAGRDRWLFAYEGFEPMVEGRRETLLALGNGYFVTRGAAAEAQADDVHYPGTYLAGGYNRLTTFIAGRLIEHEDLVNLPNWLSLTFRINDSEWLDLRNVEILSYRQALDLRRGQYERVARIRDPAGRQTRIIEHRLVHMQDKHLAAQRVFITAENWAGRLTVRTQLDGTIVNGGVLRYRRFDGAHLRACEVASPSPEIILLETETKQSRLRMTQAARIDIALNQQSSAAEREMRTEPGRIEQTTALELGVGDCMAVDKIVTLYTSRDRAVADGETEALKALERAGTFDDLLRTHALAWDHLWRRCDMEMVEAHADSSYDVHRIVRLHIFHLLQTVSRHTMELDAGIPARGWHGEGYRGHIFWDELFIFPFLNLRMPTLTRALLLYRYRRLPEARWAARAAGYDGAMFPWQSGSNGREETDVKFLNPRSGNWIRDNTHLQRHVGAGIVYSIWQYYQATDDSEFLYNYGAELLFEIARFWASAAQWNEARRRYDIRGVMGPDEFHDRYPGRDTPGLDNNAYTNVMAAWCLARALDLFGVLPDERCRELCEILGLSQSELKQWDRVSRNLYIPFLSNGIISQFEGYEALEEFDWPAYRNRYGNIMRLDLILEAEGDSPNHYKASKQADVLMLFYLFSAEELTQIFSRLDCDFDSATIPKTIDYYLRRTSHGSTLSAIVHAWVLARSCRRESWPLFTEALHSDIGDIQGGTTPEGIHLGAMAGTLDLLQRCYPGLELRGSELRFNPVLPKDLKQLSFCIRYRGHSLSVDVTPERLAIASSPGEAESITIIIGNQRFTLQPGAQDSAALKRNRELH